ncbi:MAG: hypothetical protein HND44_05135 [Chloroflexi bacterium]|nr:hypothetical protein [Ardenticatenaceae bacterium]MBL1127879.1 hypothetical protein [Chloroflexota bacterium]NOG33948.1 hypothetical protein [Chloroflexota bacterium]GIK55632.1 MAG: hypothetical protein BroJett015_12950 [Chloroflexota bacterium]
MSALTKKPFQVYLREDRLSALRCIADKRGTSVALLVRQSIDELIVSLPVAEDPLLDIVGLGDSGLGDLAENHDRYLAEMETAGQR